MCRDASFRRRFKAATINAAIAAGFAHACWEQTALLGAENPLCIFQTEAVVFFTDAPPIDDRCNAVLPETLLFSVPSVLFALLLRSVIASEKPGTKPEPLWFGKLTYPRVEQANAWNNLDGNDNSRTPQLALGGELPCLVFGSVSVYSTIHRGPGRPLRSALK